MAPECTNSSQADINTKNDIQTEIPRVPSTIMMTDLAALDVSAMDETPSNSIHGSQTPSIPARHGIEHVVSDISSAVSPKQIIIYDLGGGGDSLEKDKSNSNDDDDKDADLSFSSKELAEESSLDEDVSVDDDDDDDDNYYRSNGKSAKNSENEIHGNVEADEENALGVKLPKSHLSTPTNECEEHGDGVGLLENNAPLRSHTRKAELNPLIRRPHLVWQCCPKPNDRQSPVGCTITCSRQLLGTSMFLAFALGVVVVVLILFLGNL